jgi:hypothetical protein
VTSSCHRCLGLPTGLVPIGFQSNSLLAGLVWSILCIWPSRLILCALMNLSISAPYISGVPRGWFGGSNSPPEIPNYNCLQNPWLGGHCPHIPVLSVLSWICWTPPRTKFLGTPLPYINLSISI